MISSPAPASSSASASTNRPGCSTVATRTRPRTAAPGISTSQSGPASTALLVTTTSRDAASDSSASHRRRRLSTVPVTAFATSAVITGIIGRITSTAGHAARHHHVRDRSAPRPGPPDPRTAPHRAGPAASEPRTAHWSAFGTGTAVGRHPVHAEQGLPCGLGRGSLSYAVLLSGGQRPQHQRADRGHQRACRIAQGQGHARPGPGGDDPYPRRRRTGRVQHHVSPGERDLWGAAGTHADVDYVQRGI